MAHATEHIELANRNHEALLHLMDDPQKFPEWIAITAFYKAVQIAEAVFDAELGIHSTSHNARLDTLKMRQFRIVFNDYRVLYSASRIARYLADEAGRGYSKFTDYMKPAVIVSDLVQIRLYKFEQNMLTWLPEDARRLLTKINKPHSSANHSGPHVSLGSTTAASPAKSP